jgi:hypothetical protein
MISTSGKQEEVTAVKFDESLVLVRNANLPRKTKEVACYCQVPSPFKTTNRVLGELFGELL